MGIEVHEGIELWKAPSFDQWSRMREGHYYGMCGSNYHNPGSNLLVAQYTYLPMGGTYDAIAISVQAAGLAGAKVRLGIYDCDDELYPSDLIQDYGEVDVTATGVKTLSISQHLAAGAYFLTLITNDTSCKLWQLNIPTMTTPLGLGQNISYPRNTWEASMAYGALPSTFPTGASSEKEMWGLALRLQTLD